MMSSQLPEQSLSYWLDSVKLSQFNKLNEKLHVDVCIVGVGMTGLTAAYLLSKHNLNICLIEAGSLCHGTSGHTTAKITAQHGLIYDEFIQHFGVDNASLYYQANHEAQNLIETIINEYDIQCQFKKEDAYIYTNSDKFLEKLDNELKAYEKLSIDGGSIENLPINLQVKKAIVMKNQAQFNPAMYMQSLIEIAVENGVSFYEQTRALNVEYNRQPTVITNTGHRIFANYIIQASHYPFYDGVGFYPTRMYADRSYIIAAKTEVQINEGMYINAETPTRSLRSCDIDGENYTLIGGEGHKTGQINNTLNKYQALEQFGQDNFNIKNIKFRWSAQDYVTLDKVPYIGRVTKNQENVFVATGFHKWGMTNGTNAARILTDIIINGESDYESLYSPSRSIKLDPSVGKL